MNLHAMNVDELLKLESEVYLTLAQRLASLAKPMNGKQGIPRGSKLAPKYRGPKGETWAGRGRQPHWMKGKNPNRFLIKKAA